MCSSDLSVSNFVIWVSNLRILSLGLLYLWFGFPVHLCVGGFVFLVMVGEAWAVVEVACTFVWIFWWKVVIEGCWWVWIFGCGYGFPVHSFGFFVWL